jgi:hypothetical protein
VTKKVYIKFNKYKSDENNESDNDINKDKNKDKDKKDDKNKDQNKDKDKDQKDKDKDNKDGKNNKDQKDKDQNGGKPQPQPGGVSKQRLDNLLEAVNNEEKKVQDKVTKQKVQANPKKTEKDW